MKSAIGKLAEFPRCCPCLCSHGIQLEPRKHQRRHLVCELPGSPLRMGATSMQVCHLMSALIRGCPCIGGFHSMRICHGWWLFTPAACFKTKPATLDWHILHSCTSSFGNKAAVGKVPRCPLKCAAMLAILLLKVIGIRHTLFLPLDVSRFCHMHATTSAAC